MANHHRGQCQHGQYFEYCPALGGAAAECDSPQTRGQGTRVRAEGRLGASSAKVLAYLDVDLSTDLAALPPLVAPLLSGHSDVSIGTRLGQSSRVSRGPKREFISRSYNFLLRRTMQVRSTCRMRFQSHPADVAKRILPHIEDNGWFFDTELLIIAERSGLRIHEIPVDWVDDPDSRVDIRQTAVDDLRVLVRVAGSLLKEAFLSRQSTQSWGAGPSWLRPGGRASSARCCGSDWWAGLPPSPLPCSILTLQAPFGAQQANFIALLLTAVGNTAANRRFTFGIRGP